MDNAIIISNARETWKIEVSQLLYIKADGNYSTFHLIETNPQFIEEKTRSFLKVEVTKQIGEIEKIIKKLDRKSRASLVRIDRSTIINMEYLLRIDLSQSRLLMMDRNYNVYPIEVAKEKLAEFKKELDERV